MTTKNIIGIETKRRFKVVDTIDDLEKLANQETITTPTPKIIKPIIPSNKIYTSNSTMDEMVDYFISQGKEYWSFSPDESLELLRAEKGEDALIMTFAEAVRKYNKTEKEKEASYTVENEEKKNTCDNVYFALYNTKEGDKLINLSGTGVSIPQNYDEALKIYNDLKNNQYNNTLIEVLVGDDINTKNATQHRFAVIIDNKLQESNSYYSSEWQNNTFVKFMNGGTFGLFKLSKILSTFNPFFKELGSRYSFKETNNPNFKMGCPVYLFNHYLALVADNENLDGLYRG